MKMKRLGLIIFFGLSLHLIIFSHAQADITGPHNIQHIKGVCANCHIPHYAKSEKIWARDLLQNFGGVRQLCNSCHDGTISRIDPYDSSSPKAESGITTVFGTRYESHVMHGAADTTKDNWLGTYDEDNFPLDPNDEDSVSGHPTAWDKGGSGFYCGSCHNPHIQPEGKEDGDYLRAGSNDTGQPGNRSPFCKKCHDPVQTANSHLNSDNCQACHHPHEGYEKAQSDMGENELKIARLILRTKLDAKFIAQPNVPELTEDPNERTFISSFFCYGCHQARHVLDPSDPNNNFWQENGAAPIYGDKINNTPNNKQKRNHHPMGTQAILSGSTFLRAPGAEATQHLNKNGEITCISCHADFHGVIIGKDYNQSKENNFLRWDFTYDNAEFCIKCHIDKIMVNDEKHFWDTNTPITRKVYDRYASSQEYEKPVSCRQCMFCHFIHDGEERDNEGVSGSIRADIDALMRTGPENLAWGDRKNDNKDPDDYEDMCYGCHSNESIVGGGCNDGSLLKWSDDIHTHRFASTPDPNSPPSAVIKYGGTFPLSDGKGTATKNDYGTQQDTIFCGTCHTVHDGSVSPYLNHESGDTDLSPYMPYGFCEECHDAESDEFKFIHNSHPIDKGPNTKNATAETWPELFYTGGSGCRGGVTFDGSDSGNIICLTCHNVHTAATSHDGKVTGKDDNRHGFLLVKDNMLMSAPGGSDMCQDCHPF